MDIYKLKFTKLQNEIFRLLSINAGKALNQREIAKYLNVSPTAIAKSLKTMKDDVIIKKRGDMNLKEIELNRDNPRTISKKRTENLNILHESNILNFLEEKSPGSTIILFGSYEKGEDTIKSDVDIAILYQKPKEINLDEFEKTIQRKININFYEDLDINKELKANLYNGTVISGAIKL